MVLTYVHYKITQDSERGCEEQNVFSPNTYESEQRMTRLPKIAHFRSSTGVDLYRLPTEVFSNGFVAYSYLVLGAGVPTLIDTGSGFGNSTQDLLNGIAAVRDDLGVPIDLQDIARIIITHGHIDHFGGVADMLDVVGSAAVGIHPLDKRILTNYAERVIVATKNLTIYLQRAGVREGRLQELLNMYGFSKRHFRSVKVDFTIEDEDTLDGMTFYHVPGHCSGQVAIQFGNVLLSADHILPFTTPHLAPESITHSTGVEHYLASLRKIAKVPNIEVTLGGHEEPMYALYERIETLQTRLGKKIERIMDIFHASDQPLTISDVSKRLYPEKRGFDVLLALQEAGAHIEYLYDRGYLGVVNLQEVEEQSNPVLFYTLLV